MPRAEHAAPATGGHTMAQGRPGLREGAQTPAAPASKRALYEGVDLLRARLGIACRHSYPLHAASVAAALGLQIETANFRTPGLRGAAMPAQSLIILDGKLTAPQSNFYCAHELFHHLWHANGPGAFHCFDIPLGGDAQSLPASQNAWLEWQANEGAAELLVPLRILLPTLQRYRGSYEGDAALRKFTAYLAAEFHVPRATIELRLESLKYEIQQYLAGVPLRDLAILSNAAQQRCGIRAQSLNERYLKRLPRA